MERESKMTGIEFNYHECFKGSLIRMKIRYPDDKESLNILRAKEETRVEWVLTLLIGFSNKLQADYGYNKTSAFHKVIHIMNWIPKEFYQNIEEWLNGQELSNIQYQGISIRKLAQIMDITIYDAIELMACIVRNSELQHYAGSLPHPKDGNRLIPLEYVPIEVTYNLSREDLLRIKFANKLNSIWHDEKYAHYKANQIMDGLPKELYTNIEEFIDDKHLSDIMYNNLSVNMVIYCIPGKKIKEWKKGKKNSGIGFIPAMEMMIKYVKKGYTDPLYLCNLFFKMM